MVLSVILFHFVSLYLRNRLTIKLLVENPVSLVSFVSHSRETKQPTHTLLPIPHSLFHLTGGK